MSAPRTIRVLLLSTALIGLGCTEAKVIDMSHAGATKFPGQGAAKADAFGRALVGVAAPYPADLSLSNNEDILRSNMGARRKVAWDIVMRALGPVPLLGLADAAERHEDVVLPDGDVPKIPRWQTWYGVDDFKRLFRHLYGDLTPLERAQRVPFGSTAIDEAFEWNAASLERSERWPLERFLRYVNALGVCPQGMPDDECAKTLQSKFSGAASGNARITYSPGTMRHLLENYGKMLQCSETLDTTGFDAVPLDETQNFSACLQSEFPKNSVLIKAHWIRADFGRKVPVFDTDANTLDTVLSPLNSANWADGDREADPTPKDIYTIKLQNGDIYRLGGLHIMTKELRHWVWITLWWSDQPNDDFGADRPANFRDNVHSVWSNYKMGVVVDYRENDPDPAGSFETMPSLAAALKATHSELSWLSNPYIEHGRGNARTNCVGCHQHGGSTVGHDLNADGTLDPFDLELVIDNEMLFPDNGRSQMRTLFPADYLWSTQRVDNLNQVIKSEVANFDFVDNADPELRASVILQLTGENTLGETIFDSNCTGCHGLDGTGVTGPSLYDRVPTMDDQALVVRLLTGKPPTPMPSWSQLSNQDLANLHRYLRSTFNGE
jgi:mono/diheme cytochrome c family protein